MKPNSWPPREWQLKRHCFGVIATCLVVTLLSSCAVNWPAKPLRATVETVQYPGQTEHFELTDKHTFANPLHGVRLHYVNKKYPDDLIDVYVYPINDFQWSEPAIHIHREMRYILNGVDHSISENQLGYRGPESLSAYTLVKGDTSYQGQRLYFQWTHSSGKILDTFFYLFIEADKLIKVRTVFDAQLSPGWNGDSLVDELLPQLTIPGESAPIRAYRQQLKAQHKQRLQAVSERVESLN